VAALVLPFPLGEELLVHLREGGGDETPNSGNAASSFGSSSAALKASHCDVLEERGYSCQEWGIR